MYYLTQFDGVIYNGFLVIAKITPSNLCKSIHDIINYSSSTCPLESGKCRKDGENYKNLNIFLDEIKNNFHSF